MQPGLLTLSSVEQSDPLDHAHGWRRKAAALLRACSAACVSMAGGAAQGLCTFRTFAAACATVSAKLATKALGSMDLARLSPWLSAFSAGGAPLAALTVRRGSGYDRCECVPLREARQEGQKL